MELNNPREHNRRIWDERVRQGKDHTRPVTDQDFKNARRIVDECGWLPPNLERMHVLCLAAGGGWHGPLFAALGALVTVVDISQEMLDLDLQVAAARGLCIKAVRASMDDLSMLPPAGFDLVIQPVSTCYVPDVTLVYQQVAEVTRSGGLYISQHKQPSSLQASALPGPAGYVVAHPYYRATSLPPEIDGLQHREAGAQEFIHRWEDLVGALCRSGFVIEDLVEPRHADPTAVAGAFAHRSYYLPPYVTIKARRHRTGDAAQKVLWTPS